MEQSTPSFFWTEAGSAATLKMPEDTAKPSKRVLDPVERISEILFGLIMVLTFTCTFSAANGGRPQVRTMLFSALGCNLAWGIIDAVFYLMGCLSERGHNLVLFRAVRRATEPRHAHRIIAEALPPVLASILPATEFEGMRQKLLQLPEPPRHARLHKEDWIGGIAVFLLVFLSTFPVTLPFLFFGGRLALRVSNAVAVVMLFLSGYVYGQYSGQHPWKVGLGMVVLGAAMVGITIAFGG